MNFSKKSNKYQTLNLFEGKALCSNEEIKMGSNWLYLFYSRMAVERELDKSEISQTANLCFDESGHYLFYPTMLGVKVVNTFNNTLVKIIGKPENLRVLRVALFQVSTQQSSVLF